LGTLDQDIYLFKDKPMANSEERKRQMLEHVRRTSQVDSVKKITGVEGRTQQIREHIKRSRG